MNKIKKITTPLLVFGIIILIFQFVITPTLSAASTILNIFGVCISLVVGLFTYFYVDMLLNGTSQYESSIDEIVSTSDETELDYLPKPKRKYTKK